jgi:two-component system, NarL family, response regulator NreC
MPKTRILIVDDHALVRSGLRALVAGQPDMEVVGEADDGVAVMGPCQCLAPDVVLMDLSMPGRGGVAAIEDIRHCCPKARVLVVTMHDDECHARQAILAGAAGYILKKSMADELIDAIRTVHRGKCYVAAALSDKVAVPYVPAPRSRPNKRSLDLLSSREREVVGLLALGHTNSEVARHLCISEKTVETHRMHILEKLGLRTRADLVRFAIDHGLMDAA